MGTSDDEFEHNLNELNDIVDFPWIVSITSIYLDPYTNYVGWLSWIRGWRSSPVLSTFPVSTETMPSPSLFICLLPTSSTGIM